MESLELTYGRASRVLWGFLWRSTLLMLPLTFVAPWLLVAILPTDFLLNPEAWLDPARWLAFGTSFLVVATLLTIASFALMAVAMRWTLMSSWPDFRMQAQPLQERTENTPP